MIRLAVIVLLLAACERERRTFETPAPSGRPVTGDPKLSLYPGESPIDGAPLDPRLTGYAETAQALADGKQLYAAMNCIGCHANGGGGIGPALIDDNWRYGSSPYEIATTIITGRPNGMPSYRGKLAAPQLYSIVAYVRSLGGLARGDSESSRSEHMQTAPSQTLDHWAWPQPRSVHP